MSFLTRRSGNAELPASMLSNLVLPRGDEPADRYTPATGAQRGGLVNAKLFRGCGNAECDAGMSMPWRNRRRPVFEEQWGCSGRCMRAIVRAAVRREQVYGASAGAEETRHSHRVPLGLVMLAQGWITHPQLQDALQQQRALAEEGVCRAIGDLLVQSCGIAPECIVRGLGVQWSCPVLNLEGFSPEQMALVMPRVLVEDFGILPLRAAGPRLLYLAACDRVDASIAFAVERVSGMKAESGLLAGQDFDTARSQMLEATFVPASSETAGDGEALIARITALLNEHQPTGARLVRAHQFFWLRMWLEHGTRSRSGMVPRSPEDMLDYLFRVEAPRTA